MLDTFSIVIRLLESRLHGDLKSNSLIKLKNCWKKIPYPGNCSLLEKIDEQVLYLMGFASYSYGNDTGFVGYINYEDRVLKLSWEILDFIVYIY